MISNIATQMLKSSANQSMAALLNKYGVFVGGNPASGIAKGWQIITQPIRDYQTYPTAGFRSLDFFQQQSGSTGMTKANQNMPGAGAFPRGQMFLLEGLEVDYKPAGEPVNADSATVPDLTNDVWNVLRNGYLTLGVGSRPYLNVGPLAQFPPSFRVAGSYALSDVTTAASVTPHTSVQLPFVQGAPFNMVPYLLEETVNFVVTANYDTPVPVGTAGLLGVNMNGCLLRRDQ